MHFTIQREAFLKPLRAVAGVVERKHLQTTPVLLNVLIQLKKDRLLLTTTDQEVELVAQASTDLVVEKEGAVTVPVRKLMDVCKALREGEEITVLEEQNKITLRAGRSRFALSSLPATEFPNLNEDIGSFKFSIAKKDLRLLMEQTCFAMADQDVRYYLNGMLLEVKNAHIYGVAADGHRLAFGKIPLFIHEESYKTKQVRVIIPRKGVLELQRILDDSDEMVEVVLGENHLRVITSELQLTSKLLDGRFPDYEKIVLVSGDKTFISQRSVLKDAFQRAAALFSDRFRGIHLRLTQGSLKILATNNEQDEVEEDLEINYDGHDLEIGFNVKYLIDFLNAIPNENIQFTFSDSNSSARVEGVGAESGVYIIMPMRI